MMEVKHSPSSQMDFRNASTKGLPTEEEDEEMDTLLDSSGAVKSIANSSIDCDSTPILNGSSKYSGLEDGMEIDFLDEEADEELKTTVSESETKNKKEESNEQTEDIDIFDLDLEQAVDTEKKITNGETADTSNVRDAGDDLDTLLSKINDLVEDCMEPSAKVDSPTTASKKVVDVKKNKVEDVTSNKTEKDASNETRVVESEETIDQEDQEGIESKSEEKVESETEEELIKDDETFEVKSVPDLSEDVSEENGLEVTESDLETAEGGSLKNVDDKISEVCVEESNDDKPDEEMPVMDISEEISASEIVEEEPSGETVDSSETVVKPNKLETDPAESLDIDDDIVCLDSPMAEEKEEESISDNTKEDSLPSFKDSMSERNEEEEKQLEIVEKQNSEQVSSKEVDAEEAVTKPGENLSNTMEDDDIFLIDDDDEPIKTTESNGKSCGSTADAIESPTEEEKLKKEEVSNLEKIKSIEKLPEKEEEELSTEKGKEDAKLDNEKEEENNENKTEVSSGVKSLETNVDDDDVVCLDDSFEATENSKTDQKEKLSEIIPQKTSDTILNESVSVALDKESNEVVKDTEEKTVNKIEDISSEQVIESLDNSEKLKHAAKTSEKPVKETSNITPEETPSVSISQKTPDAEVPSKVVVHTDVISLDDDDEDDVAPSTSKQVKKPSEVPANKPLAFLSDNSDNARDGVEEKDDKTGSKVPIEKSAPTSSEINSNSSSNLLKESTTHEREESRSEPSEQPPAKKIRLSQDEASSRNSIVSQEDTTSKLLDDDDVMEINDNDDEANKVLKRVHSSESIASDFKKPKTDSDAAKTEDEKQPELLEEIIPAKVESVKEEEKVDKKLIDTKQFPLYPPPNFDAAKVNLSLDFLRRFKKSIHKMNKSDLEELVLQKIVEAIVHKSEFSEMRELIEKQEKIISGHRNKITELNKQFRDLEMVHHRVLKDLETKNSQFIMPVKITRAVGLQVFFPSKKYDQPMASLAAPCPAHPSSSSSLARSVSTSSNTSSIPEKTPISTPTAHHNSSPQTTVQTTPVGVSNQPRRGCVQKLTPMRPDGPRSQMGNRGVTAGVVSSSTPSPMTPKDSTPKVLNRQAASKPRLSQSPMGVNASNSVLPQQAHNLHSLSTPPGLDPERAKPSIPQGIATKKTSGMVKSYPASKRIPKSWQSEQTTPVQPSSPLTPQNTSSPMALPQSPLVNSPAVAKTPHKSVIDLTDEDEMAPTPSPKPSNAITAAQKQANTGMHRVGPYKVSVVPSVQLQQQQQPRPSQAKAAQPRPPSQLVPKSNGTPPNAVRRTPELNQRYRHPAPLPNQPIHSSNPLWKLPPARPTIRISNLDSGIVISWTIEDMAKEKYAESTSYQIYAYQETSGPPLVESWRHVGDVKAMLLPMAVTLTQFQEGQRYYFAVRAVDAHNRCGPFSFAKTWS